LEKLDIPIAKIREPRPNGKNISGTSLWESVSSSGNIFYYISRNIENQATFPKFLDFGKVKLKPLFVNP